MTFETFFSNNFVEIIGLIFIWIILNKEKVIDKEYNHKYMVIFYCEIVELIAFNIEKVLGFLNEPTFFRIFFSAVGYTLRPLLVYLFVRLVWPHEDNKVAKVFLTIPIIVNAISGISPVFTNMFYMFNVNNHFCRGPLGWIFMVTVIGYILLFVYYVIKQRHLNEKMNTMVLLLIALFLIVSTIVGTIIYDMEWLARLSIVYGIVFCLFALDVNKLKNTIYALQENQDLKHALNDLEIAKKEAEQANEVKTTFLMNMSHDIRTPLNGIMGMIDIADHYPNDIDKQTECRTKIKEASNILLDLVNDVLDKSKLDTNHVVLERVSFNFLDVMKESYAATYKLAEKNHVKLIENNCSISHLHLIGSPLHLKRIIINILSNAIKYNKENGKIYITCKEVDYDGTFIKLEFKCEDTGIGMSEEFQKHIFEPFTQEEQSARSSYNGTGLGMSIVKGYIDKMGGTIKVESVLGQGSIFDVVIPLEVDKEVKEQKVDNESYSIEGINILLVEDNELNLDIATFVLEDNHANVVVAKNGQEAVQRFQASKEGEFDVILMDIMMPVMNGYEATKQIRNMDRKDAKDIPIIAMTANAFTEDKLKAQEIGMNGHISKPIDNQLLVKTIASIVNKGNLK